jgi:NADH-quinone oxidoreductase subunit G
MLNPARFPYQFPLKSYASVPAEELVAELAAVLAASAAATGKPVPAHLQAAVGAANVTDEHRAIAQLLSVGNKRAVWLGALASRHPQFADLRALAAGLAQLTGATLGRITEGGNSAGAYLAGAIPHREAGGRTVAAPGLNTRNMLQRPLRAYLLVGGIEPALDTFDSESVSTLAKAELIVAVTPFASEHLKGLAHVLLPMGSFAESSGTYVNCEGRWQSQAGAAVPVGEARPGWKILRVLGNLLNLGGFEYQSSEEVLSEVRKACAGLVPAPYSGNHAVAARAGGGQGVRAGDGAPPEAAVIDVPMYQVDALVRRAPALQKTREGRTPAASY